MTALFLTPVVLSMLALAAHFLRHGRVELIVLTVAVTGLLAVRRAWAARVIQAALLLGAAEWVRTCYVLYSVRMDMGVPATRMVAILGGVAGFTLLSALLFQHRRLAYRYHLKKLPDRREIF